MATASVTRLPKGPKQPINRSVGRNPLLGDGSAIEIAERVGSVLQFLLFNSSDHEGDTKSSDGEDLILECCIAALDTITER